jgi:hypothetical protein
MLERKIESLRSLFSDNPRMFINALFNVLERGDAHTSKPTAAERARGKSGGESVLEIKIYILPTDIAGVLSRSVCCCGEISLARKRTQSEIARCGGEKVPPPIPTIGVRSLVLKQP